jgi:LPPG:FO 2-phospho-L-lactate transferase
VSGPIVALTGGVGGAKLARGLVARLAPEDLHFVVNVGDDFEHLGLHVSPDLDTLLYTLSGESDTERGWGRRGESWQFLDALRGYDGPDWFALGDRDLATHVLRTHALAEGARLTEVTARLATALGVRHAMLPVTDDPLRTVIETGGEALPFQHYFVRERCAPAVTGFRFDGAERARCTPEVRAALADPDLAGVVLCPSNPFVSIDPILAVAELRAALAACAAPIIAVSPIIGGDAVKGPTAKMMDELGVPRSAAGVAGHYGARSGGGLLDGFVLDATDAALQQDLETTGLAVRVEQTLMRDLDDRIALADAVLAFLASLRTS